jgi:hypothetical protein
MCTLGRREQLVDDVDQRLFAQPPAAAKSRSVPPVAALAVVRMGRGYDVFPGDPGAE